jgi:hypothetical protein
LQRIKAMGFFGRNKKEAQKQAMVAAGAAAASEKPSCAGATVEMDIFNDPAGAARVCQPLTAQLGENFALSQLYTVFNAHNIAHPHLTIRAFRDGGYLVKGEGDHFTWNTAKFLS